MSTNRTPDENTCLEERPHHDPFTACFLKFKDNTGEHFVVQQKRDLGEF